MAKLLDSAGAAIKSLTTVESDPEQDVAEHASIGEQREKFAAASSQYLKLLSSIDVGLRRQINALEEADIIPAEAASKETQNDQSTSPVFAAMGGPAAQPKQVMGNRAAITGGGLGSLDVGWLNSRNDHNGKGMEAELWQEAQSFIEGLRHKKAASEDKEGEGHMQEAPGPRQHSGQNGNSMDQT